MDAAQSSCVWGIGRVLDVPGPLENGLSLSWRRKITKCQLRRVDADNLIVVGDFAKNCQAMLGTHGPFLSARQRDVVADIYRRELRTWVRQLPRGRAMTYQGLLSDEELAQILGIEISFEQLDQSFTYMLEDCGSFTLSLCPSARHPSRRKAFSPPRT